MILSYLTIALRHLIKDKTFAFIHVFGLSIGLTAFFLILQYVDFELSFDHFHSNRDELFRVALERKLPDGTHLTTAKNFPGLRKLLKDNFPEVEAATGFYKTPANTGVLFKYKGKIFNETGGELNADSAFFQVFQTLLLAGDPATVLDHPHNVVLSQSMAKKVFGDADPIGQRLQRPDDGYGETDCVVTGVLMDVPANSHFHANFIVPLQYRWPNPDPWMDASLMTYITLNKQNDPESVDDRLNTLYRRIETVHPEVMGAHSFLQPVTSIHLSSHLKDELESNGSKSLVFVAALIALVILVIGWINYINLETARFLLRGREVGVRRVIGSGKSDLAIQFLIEYLCVLIFAFILSALIIAAAVPYFSYLTGIPAEGISWPRMEILLGSLIILLGGSIAVGIYPALFLLRLNPVAALKGKFGDSKQGSGVRQSLVVFQFCSSLVLIAFVLVIQAQLSFMRSADKKFHAEQVVVIRNPTAYSNESIIDKHRAYTTLGDKLLDESSVEMISSSSAIPGTEIGFTYVNLLKRNVNDPYDPTAYKTLFVDYNYIPFFGLELLAGRNFDPPGPVSDWKDPWEDKDWLTLILNESAVRALGFESPEEAVDQIVEFENFEDHFQKHRIIGVIRDYHHEAVKKQIFPMILSPNYGSFQQVYYSVRLQAGTDPADALNKIQKTWKEVFPEKPFEYFFLDEYYDQQFKREIQFQRMFSIFAGVAIAIASLGILGMTLFQANIRRKEISIRKVLGASVSSILVMLSRSNAKVIALSLLISVPLIWLIASEWLSTYPLRIAISLWFFLIPSLAIISIVGLTSIVQIWSAAQSNPVEHLKNE